MILGGYRDNYYSHAPLTTNDLMSKSSPKKYGEALEKKRHGRKQYKSKKK